MSSGSSGMPIAGMWPRCPQRSRAWPGLHSRFANVERRELTTWTLLEGSGREGMICTDSRWFEFWASNDP